MMKRIKAGMLIDALILHLERHGVPDISPPLAAFFPVRCSVDGLKIMWCKKARPFPGCSPCQSIDIWSESGGKVFSASFYPLDVVSFKRGSWSDELLAKLYAGEVAA